MDNRLEISLRAIARGFESLPLRQNGALPLKGRGIRHGYSALFRENADPLEQVVCMTHQERQDQALKNAEASLHMEGLRSSQEMEDARRKVLNGQMTEQQYLQELLQSATQKDG